MKMSMKNLLTLTSEGRLTLQVPDLYVMTHKGTVKLEDTSKDVVEMPDDWFMYESGGLPCVGRQEGFLHLTRKGYEANKRHLKKSFEDACSRGLDRSVGERGWPAFEEYAEKFYSDMAKAIVKKVKFYKKMMTEMEGKMLCVIP